MQYIYTRVSTDHQTNDSQLKVLKERYPNAQINTEIGSGAKERPILKTLLGILKEGDELIVYSLSRLGRNAKDLLGIVEELMQRKVIFISNRENIDCSTPTGKLFMTLLSGFAEFERATIIEKTKHGLEAARAKGIRLGRPSVLGEDVKIRALELSKQGMSYGDIAKALKCSKTYAYKLLNKSEDSTAA